MSNQSQKTTRRAKRLRRDSGATLVEYAIASALLVMVFTVAGFALVPKIRQRGDLSIETAQKDIPCFCKILPAAGANCKPLNSGGYQSVLQEDESDLSCQ